LITGFAEVPPGDQDGDVVLRRAVRAAALLPQAERPQSFVDRRVVEQPDGLFPFFFCGDDEFRQHDVHTAAQRGVFENARRQGGDEAQVDRQLQLAVEVYHRAVRDEHELYGVFVGNRSAAPGRRRLQRWPSSWRIGFAAAATAGPAPAGEKVGLLVRGAAQQQRLDRVPETA
jgi:hypothetical protein